MNESRLDHAKLWAGMHHKGQVRKYTGEPYIEHPLEVAEMVKEHGLSETAIIAAILHDTVEDTGATLEDVEELFGTGVAEYVWYLTKPPVFVGNRATRKSLDRDRLSAAPEEVKFIKFYDVFHNASSIREHDPEFYDSWRHEMQLLFLAMNVHSLDFGEKSEEINEFLDTL